MGEICQVPCRVAPAWLLFWLAFLPLSMQVRTLQAQSPEVVSESGYYRGSFESRLQPIRINVMHSWVVQLNQASGEPLDNAVILVSGGMPLHDHGLSTAPRVTQGLGGGRYVIDGLKFHMNGLWLVTLSVEHPLADDVLTFELEI